MKTIARIITLSCATLALAHVDARAQSAAAEPQGAVPVVAEAPIVKGAHLSPQDAAEADRLLELQRRAILSQMPDVIAVRLDEHDVPVAQMDLYFGGSLPESDAALLALLEEFDFGEAAPSEKRREQAHGRTVLLPSGVAPGGPADLALFDPQADLVVEFRRLFNPTEISCSGTFVVNYNGTKPTGTIMYFDAHGPMVAASVGPQRQSSADPDLRLDYSSGSGWVTLSSSLSATTIDSVFSATAGCYGLSWRFRVHMYAGGAFSMRVHRFNAQ